MALPEHILLTYGYLLLFGWVLVEQFGIPLPATPVLLTAGGLSAEHQISFTAALAAGMAACLVADTSSSAVAMAITFCAFYASYRWSRRSAFAARRTRSAAAAA